MGNFTGKLRANEIFKALFNMIISQEVFADNFAETDELVSQARVDGSMYGDTKLYYATDVLSTSEWGNDAEAENLLKLNRPDDPKCQAIYLDKFRKIALTLDDYLSKRAWSTPDAFNSVNSVYQSMLRETKNIYDETNYNMFIGGTYATDEDGNIMQSQIKTISSTDAADGKKIAEKLANIMADMKKPTRDYNAYGFLRKYNPSKLKVVFNSAYLNRIKNVDLPVIFDNAGLKEVFNKESLYEEYFTRPIEADDIGANKLIHADGTIDLTKGTLRAFTEITIGTNHYFAGEAIKSTEKIDISNGPAAEGYIAASQVRVQVDDVICKIIGKLPPYMSAFEVGTSFFNPLSLTTNYYLIFGHNTLEAFKNYPFVTLKVED